MILKDKKIGVFIMGGIAAYKVPELIRQLIKQGAHVRVAMTVAAQAFVTPLTLQVLTKQRVLTDTFDEAEPSQVQHVALADWCDLALVVPATANGIAKLAHGLADDVVTSTLLALAAPKLVVPAMNVHMYENPATQRNLVQLQADGLVVMEPETGFLAEGYHGKGRLPQLERIVSLVEWVIAQHTLPQLLAGKHVLISAGGTRERIDPVRYISNDSSGKMGYAMAWAARLLGATVTLVSTVRNMPVPEQVAVHYVESASQMAEAMQAHFAASDYAVMAAAVSDYRLATPATQKLKKTAQQTSLQLELVENPDILAHLAANKAHQVVIGFAAETEQVLDYATAKLAKKRCDWLLVNDVSQAGIGFNADENQLTLLSQAGAVYELGRHDKLSLALAAWQQMVQ